MEKHTHKHICITEANTYRAPVFLTELLTDKFYTRRRRPTEDLWRLL